MPSLFDTPESEAQTSAHPYASGPPEGAKSLFGLDDGIMPNPAGRASLFDQPADQLVQGSTASVYQSQLEAGIDQGQGLLWEAGNQMAQLMGYTGSDAQVYMEEQAKKNEVAAAAVPAQGLWDQFQRGIGTLAVAAAPVAVGGLAAAPLGLGTAGMATAGAITSAGMNLGDLTQKGRELDPEFVASASDAALSGVLGLVELVPAGRVLSTFNKAKPALGMSLKESLTARLPSLVGNVTAAGAGEGIQDLATGIKAYTSTDTDINDAAMDNLVESMINEAVLGTLIAGPIASVGVSSQVLSDITKDRATTVTMPDGTVEMAYEVPEQDIATQAGFFKNGINVLMGKSTDVINGKLAEVDAWKDIRDNFVANKTERAQALAEGRGEYVTQDILEQTMKADMRDGAGAFFDAPDDIAEMAIQDKAKGLRTATNPEAQAALDGIWKMDANKVAMGSKYVTDFKPLGDTYVPFSNPNNEAISKRTSEFLQDVRQDLLNQGWDTAKVDTYMEKVADPWAMNVKKNGRYMPDNDAADGIASMMTIKFAELATITDPVKRAKAVKRINSSIKQEIGAVVKKTNSLEQERQLAEVSDATLQKWRAGDAKSVYLNDTKAASARLAHIDKWGENNEVYWAKVTDVLTEAYGRGIEVPADIMGQFSTLINTAQKLPTKKVSQGAKKAMEAVRLFQNVTKLPLAVIPSIGEAMFIMNEYGTFETLKTMGQVIKYEMQRKVTGKQPPAQYQRLMNDLAMSMREATDILNSRIAEESINATTLESKFFNLTGLPQFTEMLRMTGALMSEKAILDAANKITSGSKSEIQKSARLLAEAGLDSNKVVQWFQEGADLKDPYYKNSIRPATLALAEDVVVHPTPLKKPAWMGNEYLMLVAHLKSFATVFTNSMMKTWWDNLTMGQPQERIAYALKLFPLIATFVATQAALAGLREWIRTGDTENWDDKTFYEHIMAGLSYLGGFGMGLESIHGTEYGRSVVESLAGPSAGTLTDIGKMINVAMSRPEDFVDTMLQTLHRQVKGMPGIGVLFEEAIN